MNARMNQFYERRGNRLEDHSQEKLEILLIREDQMKPPVGFKEPKK